MEQLEIEPDLIPPPLTRQHANIPHTDNGNGNVNVDEDGLRRNSNNVVIDNNGEQFFMIRADMTIYYPD
jgi:hypothetical protein